MNIKYKFMIKGFALLGIVGLISSCGGGGGGGGATPVTLSTFQAAETVIGQADFAGASKNQGGLPGANTLSVPHGAPAEGSLYLADQDNHRILGFNTIPTTNNANADFVIGQAIEMTAALSR